MESRLLQYPSRLDGANEMNITPATRIAMIYHPIPDCLGYGGFLEHGMKQLCATEHFIPGEETEGFDHYIYIDDGPTYYMEPKYHPATYMAIDMVVKPYWYLQPIDYYYQRLLNFDNACVSSTATLQYCQERGYERVRFIAFAADPEYHKPYPVEREFPFVAVWHNCEGRIAASEQAKKQWPNGWVTWRGNELYAESISRGKCALNWLRGNIVNMRVFEVMATGTPLITTRHEDMEFYGLLEGEHYLGFDDGNIDQMIEQIAWVQEHQIQAMEMAARAREFVLANHTYLHRAKEILIGC